MTWTLRLYDGNGIEIGWVTADPYEWGITYPDTDADWLGVRVELEGYGNGKEALSGEEVRAHGCSVRFDRVKYHNDTPKSHLEWVRDEMLKGAEVESVSLADE